MLQTYSVIQGKIVPSAAGSPLIEVYILPDDEERSHLINDYKINEHTMISCVDANETPRIEFENEYTAVIMKYPKNYSAEDNFFFRIKSMGIFIFPPTHIVVLLDEPQQLFPRRFPAVALDTPQDVMLRIMLQVVRHFEEHLNSINMLSNELERDISSSMDNQSLMNTFTLGKGLIYYVNALRWNSHVLTKLTFNSSKLHFDEENMELLEDISIENNQFLEQAKTYSQVLEGMMSARASMINNNLNLMMKNMNAIVIAISVPTFITGVGGMSEFTSLFGKKWAMAAYPVFFIFMAALALFIYFLITCEKKK
ncbi:MAG: magnesium transporter CorA family protein [Lentisphaeria bacterium]|nr:magnesium transporter CorA family protein [Lentisphaeria bacterium]